MRFNKNKNKFFPELIKKRLVLNLKTKEELIKTIKQQLIKKINKRLTKRLD